MNLVVGQGFSTDEMIRNQAATGKLYNEFLRVPDLSAGLYVLPAGSIDPQQPHNEDEVYYVISGVGKLRVEAEDFDAVTGSILYVAKHATHKFHSITEDLQILVFFAPAHT